MATPANARAAPIIPRGPDYLGRHRAIMGVARAATSFRFALLLRLRFLGFCLHLIFLLLLLHLKHLLDALLLLNEKRSHDPFPDTRVAAASSVGTMNGSVLLLQQLHLVWSH